MCVCVFARPLNVPLWSAKPARQVKIEKFCIDYGTAAAAGSSVGFKPDLLLSLKTGISAAVWDPTHSPS